MQICPDCCAAVEHSAQIAGRGLTPAQGKASCCRWRQRIGSLIETRGPSENMGGGEVPSDPSCTELSWGSMPAATAAAIDAHKVSPHTKAFHTAWVSLYQVDLVAPGHVNRAAAGMTSLGLPKRCNNTGSPGLSDFI